MRVLFLSQIVPYPPHGGVLQRGYHIIRQLSRRASVHLLAFVHKDVLPTEAALEESRRALEEFCETVEYCPLWAKTSIVHRVAALAASTCSTVPFSLIAHRSSVFERQVRDALKRDRFDLVHVDTLALSQFIEFPKTLPAVLTHHNIESILMERRAHVETRTLARQFLQRESTKLRRYERMASPRYDVNIVVSPNDGETLAGRVPGVKTAVVPNGVDVDYFTPDPSQQTPAVVYAGGMNMFANRDAVMYFLEAIWPLIVAKAPDIRFIAVGQDPPKELLALAARDRRIVVPGYVPDMRPYVQQAAVYVVPLRVGGGTRLKVLDAMAMGKAMVSTTIGCEGISCKAGEHVLLADSPDAFARATLELLADRERRLQLGAAARALVERAYSWPVVGDILVDTYRDAIDRARPSS